MRRVIPCIVLLCVALAGCAGGFQFRGDLYMRAELFPQAIDYYEAARPANRGSAALHRKLGLAYMKVERYEDALAVLDVAREIDPGSGATMLYTGLAHEGLGHLDEAIREYRQYTQLGRFSKHRGQIEKRLEALSSRRSESWAREQIANEARLEATPPEDHALAVVPLHVAADDMSLGSLGDAMASQLATDLSAVRRLSVLERVRLDALLRELDLVERGKVDAAMAPRVGRLLGARRIVAGSVYVLAGNNVRADLSVVDVVTGQVEARVTEEAELSRFFSMQKTLCFSILDELGIEPSPAEREDIERVPTRSLGAFLAYGSGVAMARAGQAADARAAYGRAREEDPAFLLVREALDELDALESTADALDPVGDVVADVGVLEDPYYYPDPDPIPGGGDIEGGLEEPEDPRPEDNGGVTPYTPTTTGSTIPLPPEPPR